MLLVLSRKKLRRIGRMKEYEETGQTTQESNEQKEPGGSSSWASKFLGLPSKMGGWVLGGKKPNEEELISSSNETTNDPLTPQDSQAPPASSSLVEVTSTSRYEVSEDEDDDHNSCFELINENEIGGMAEEMNMTYSVNGDQRDRENEDQGDSDNEDQEDSENDARNIDKEKEDENQGELKNQTTDQSDSVSTDSFASASSPPPPPPPPPEENSKTDFTLVKIKQELEEEEIQEVDKNGKKVKLVKIPVLELAELVRCREELTSLKGRQKGEKEKVVALQQGSHDAPVEPASASTVKASSSTSTRRNPGRSAKKSKKKSAKTEKSVKTEKNKKKSAGKVTKERDSKKTRRSSAKEKKPKRDELSCPECGRTFTAKSGLRNHELRHRMPNGQFKCKVCEKDHFKTAHHLRQHEACHFPSEKCNFCEKKFGTRSNLANHQRTSKVCKAGRQNGA